MKKILNIVILCIGIIILLLIFLPPYRATRTEETVNVAAFNIITKWQDKLRDDGPFDLSTFSSLFTPKDVLSEVNLYEEKMRNFYNISLESNISAVGELMKIQKKNFILDVNIDNFFPITKFTDKKRYWHWLYGVFIPIKQDNPPKYAFIRLGYDCRINIMESFIGEDSFISLLDIDGNTGEILNKKVEHVFIERLKSKKIIM